MTSCLISMECVFEKSEENTVTVALIEAGSGFLFGLSLVMHQKFSLVQFIYVASITVEFISRRLKSA